MCNDISTPKSLASLVLSGLVPKEDLRLQDLPKTFTALRSYGVTEEESLEIISFEVSTLKEYEITRANSISPTLIDIFGIQHVKDALSYAYLFLDEFELSLDEFDHVLRTLLKEYKPEQLILNPEIIRYFLKSRAIMDKKYFESIEDLENKIIENLREEKPLYMVTENG